MKLLESISRQKNPYEGHPYLDPRSGNDGNSSDSDEAENEKLFEKNSQASKVVKIPEELKQKEVVKESLAGKRGEPELSEEEKRRLVNLGNSEEVVLDENDSEESEVEPPDCDLILGQYEEVQRTKNKLGRRYRCKFVKVIFKIDQKDYVAAKLNAEIEY